MNKILKKKMPKIPPLLVKPSNKKIKTQKQKIN
jgi:hypothetical protein